MVNLNEQKWLRKLNGRPLCFIDNSELYGVTDESEEVYYKSKEMIQLADTTTTTVTEDIPVIVSASMLETAVAKRTARKIFPTNTELVNAPGSQLNVPGLNTVTFAASGTEGSITPSASALDTNAGVSTKTATPAYRSGSVYITYQSLAAAKHDLVKLTSRRLGIDAAVDDDKVGYGIFADDLTTASKTSDKSSDAWNATAGSQANMTNDITEAYTQILSNNFNPTHSLFNVALAKYIMRHDDFIDAKRYGAGSVHTKTGNQTDLSAGGVVGYIYGTKVVLSPNIYESSSYSATDNFFAADAEFAGMYVDKESLTVKFKDFPENLETLWVAYYATDFIVPQPNAAYGYLDVVDSS
ncbi:MAG: hypothetical protein ACTSPB_02105 [Candidatus Thorarchaeota archaeon]